MAEKIKLVRNDTKPYIVLSLTDLNTGDSIDVSSAVVKMYFRATGSSTILATITATKLAGKLNASYRTLILKNVSGLQLLDYDFGPELNKQLEV